MGSTEEATKKQDKQRRLPHRSSSSFFFPANDATRKSPPPVKDLEEDKQEEEEEEEEEKVVPLSLLAADPVTSCTRRVEQQQQQQAEQVPPGAYIFENGTFRTATEANRGYHDDHDEGSTTTLARNASQQEDPHTSCEQQERQDVMIMGLAMAKPVEENDLPLPIAEPQTNNSSNNQGEVPPIFGRGACAGIVVICVVVLVSSAVGVVLLRQRFQSTTSWISPSVTRVNVEYG